MTAALEGSFTRSLAAVEARAGQPAWLSSLRREGKERFLAHGFPTTQEEDWKYTSLAPLAALPLEVASPSSAAASGVTGEEILAATGPLEGARLVFVNGRFAPHLSTLDSLPRGLGCRALSEALASPSPALEPFLGHAADVAHPLVALNNALFDDGAWIQIAEGAQVESPLHLVFYSAPQGVPALTSPRVLICAGAHSRASVVEHYCGRDGANALYLTNAVTELWLGADAELQHAKLQREASPAYHLASAWARLERDSRLTSHSMALGAALARNEVRSYLGAPGAQVTLNGLYMASGQQHLDNHTVIEHAVSNCVSRELYKGILDDRSRAVFTGQVRVDPDAQRTDSSQSNKNLLLSDDAVIDTQPQLAIYADDVKCTHGATVGQLDEDAVFYLCSRGIDRATARSLLTYAFASEMVSLLQPPSLREVVRRVLAARLAANALLEEVA